MTLAEKLNPRVGKRFLILTAGLAWVGVGIMLISYAAGWLAPYSPGAALLYYAAGIGSAIPIHIYGFSKIAEKNLGRLVPLTEKRCFFSFITWKSYLIIVIMIAMGITLRHSRLPKQYLSVVYNGIGLALLLSGTKYFRSLIPMRK